MSVVHATMVGMVDQMLKFFAPHVQVIHARPSAHIPAATDGTRIWVDPRMNQTEYRCAVMHELVHIGLGHTDCQPTMVESEVRAITAKLLVSFPALVEAWRWAASIDELADELGVTRLVLEDRLERLTEDQAQQLGNISSEVGKIL